MRGLIKLSKIDITLAWGACILAVPITYYIYIKFAFRFIAIGIVVLVVALAYLLARRRHTPRLLDKVATPVSSKWLNAAFFGLFAYSVVAYLLRPDPYIRPIGYFIAIALMAVVLFVEFALTKSRPGLGLLKVVLITGSLVWTESLLYPSVVGVDPWYHQWVCMGILNTGYPPPDISYTGFPGMHYIIAGVSLLTGLGYKMAVLISISLAQIILNPLFAYLIGRDLYNEKIGLVAALLVGVANWHVLFSYWVIPNGLAVALILPIAYIVFKLSRRWSWRLALSGLLLASLVIITHPIASVMLVLVLGFIWIGLWVYGKVRESEIPSRHFLISGGFVGVATLLYWYFVADNFHILIGLFKSGFSYEYFGTPVPGIVPAMGQVIYKAPLWEQLFNYMGMFLFYGLAILGCLVAFSKRLLNQKRFAYTLAGLLVLTVVFLGFIAQGVIIVGRWLCLAQIMLALPLGVGLVWVAGRSWQRAALASLLVFGLAFMMVLSPQANMDNQTFGGNTIIRSAFTEGELEAADDAVAMWDGDIAVDATYYILRYKYPNRLVDMSECIASADFTACGDKLILVRDDIIDNPCRVGENAPLSLTYDLRDKLLEQGFVEVYDWGTVGGYIREG